MKFTGNLGLKKPEGTDVVNIDDLNQNFDIKDVEVVKVASPTQNGRMSAADKAKLDGIEAGAQRNTVTSVNNKTGAVTLTASDVGASPTGHTHAFADITGKPTTLSGYGITDAIPTSQKGSANGVASLDGSAKVPTTQLPSASTTVQGIVQLNDTLTSTSTTQAATANAVKQVNDAVAAHLADYVKHTAYAVATGSANAYAVTLNHAPTSYIDGMAVSVKINVDSTGASTLNVNGLGAKPLKKANGNDVTNLKANGVYTFRYNASTGNFILQGEGGEGSAQPAHVLSGQTFTNENGLQTGEMPNRGAYNITPGTSNITTPAGYHNGSGVVYGDPDLIPSNIRQGVNIFGVIGTLVEGKRYAQGQLTPSSNTFTVRGLQFRPSTVVIRTVNTYPGQPDRYDYAVFYQGLGWRGSIRSSASSAVNNTNNWTFYNDGFDALVFLSGQACYWIALE